MEPADLKQRLAALPGVISATVGEETVALLLRADADARLLKARAQAICAEMGETRPLVVLGGGRAAAGALARSGGPPGSGSWARRTTPVTFALASLFVLSAVVLAPGDSKRSNPLFRRAPSGSVALAPPAPAPAHEAVASPALSAPRSTPPGSMVPTFVRGLAPVPSSPRPAAVGAGPLLLRLETASSVPGPAAAPAPGPSAPSFGPQLASAGPSTSRPVEPGKAATPRSSGKPAAAAGSDETAAPAEPVAAPVSEIRTSSREVTASSSDDVTLSASAVGDRRVQHKSADRNRRSSPKGQVASTATGSPGNAGKADKADNASKAADADNADKAGGPGSAGSVENSENRGDKADKDDRTGGWGERGNAGRAAPSGRLI